MTKSMFSLIELERARQRLNRLHNGCRIRNDEEARRFIEERGFVLLMPVEGIPLPSLSMADAAEPWPGFAITDRAWAWKETLPGRKLCAYTKLIHGRGTFISWRLYPAFLRIYGPDGDPDHEYESGRLARTDRDLYRLVEEYGPIDSRALWLKAKPFFNGKRARFIAALERLQMRFMLTVAGGSLEGWSMHTWDLVERQAPPEGLAPPPTPPEARSVILMQTIRNGYLLSERQLSTILRWPVAALRQNLMELTNSGRIIEAAVEGAAVRWYTISDKLL